MPTRCVVAGCSNTPDSTQGIYLHKIPFHDDNRPEAKSRRKQWIDFVKRRRANFNPSATSVICSSHFLPEDYNQRFDFVAKHRPQLVKDKVGTVAIPRIFVSNHEKHTKLSDRNRRKVLKDAIASEFSPEEVELPVREIVRKQQGFERQQVCDAPSADEESSSLSNTTNIQQHGHSDHTHLEKTKDSCCQTTACIGCLRLQDKTRQLQNAIKGFKERIEKLKQEKTTTVSIGIQCAVAYDDIIDYDSNDEMTEEGASEMSDIEEDDDDDERVEDEDEDCFMSDDGMLSDDYQLDSEPDTAGKDDGQDDTCQ